MRPSYHLVDASSSKYMHSLVDWYKNRPLRYSKINDFFIYIIDKLIYFIQTFNVWGSEKIPILR